MSSAAAIPEHSRAWLDSDEIHAMTEVAFVAAGTGNLRDAEPICRTLIALRPTRAFGYVGLALAYLNAGRPPQAIAVFESAYASIEPLAAAIGKQCLDDDWLTIRIYHALALHIAQRAAERIRLLAQVPWREWDAAISAEVWCGDPALRRLAESLHVLQEKDRNE